MTKKGVSQPIIAVLAIAILSIILLGTTQLSIGRDSSMFSVSGDVPFKNTVGAGTPSSGYQVIPKTNSNGLVLENSIICNNIDECTNYLKSKGWTATHLNSVDLICDSICKGKKK